MKRLLFADNDESFLMARSELLRQAGYDVVTATGPLQASHLLSELNVDLAILDIRLEDDFDPRDVSGLELAKNEELSMIPKILLTNFPSYTSVREALSETSDGVRPAVDFVAKAEGAEALIRAVDSAFLKQVVANSDLKIRAPETISVAQLCGMILPSIETSALPNRVAELENLFRRAFRVETEIKIERMLWKRESRVALLIFTFYSDRLPSAFVVVCGRNDDVSQEAARFREYGPLISEHTILSRAAETPHFAANCYILVDAQAENLEALDALYAKGPEKPLNNALKALFVGTLSAWHQGKRAIEEEKGLSELYRERLGLSQDNVAPQEFRRKITSLAARILVLGSRVQLIDGGTIINFGGQVFSYVDPVDRLFSTPNPSGAVPLTNTPGAISTDSTFTDGSGGVWVTDFANAGLAPIAWNHVALEAAVRFDLTQSTNIKSLHQMEQILTEGDFSRLYHEDAEGSLKKPVRIIQFIRKQAPEIVANDVLGYHLGIFFQAARRLASYDPDTAIIDKELARFAHLFIAMCVVGEKLGQAKGEQKGNIEAAGPGIVIDRDNRKVSVEGAPVSIRGNSYDLLCFLYDRANGTCTRQDLIEAVFHERYDPADENQESKLNTVIRRLRERIEDDSDEPRYLRTEPGGYRLVSGSQK